jgi:DNA-binding NarL/FixJ family response regulator
MGDAEPAQGGAVTVLVVDDQEAFRNAMRALIDAAEGFTLVGEASSGEEALDLVDELLPRMVIMDKRMPGMGGIEASRAITARHPTVVVLIASIDEPDAEMLASSRAAAFVRKQAMSTGLLRQLWREHGI